MDGESPPLTTPSGQIDENLNFLLEHLNFLLDKGTHSIMVRNHQPGKPQMENVSKTQH